MKRIFTLTSILFLFLFFVTGNMMGQKLVPTDKSGVYMSVKHPVYFDVSPPLSKMIKDAKPITIDKEARERREELIEEAFEKFIKSKMKGNAQNRPDELAKIQKQYSGNTPKAETLTSLANFDGVTNVDGVAPPDTHGDVSTDRYMQCVNNSTAIYDKNGATIQSHFPTSDFWQGTPYDDRNDGDAVILWDEDAQRWFVTQFYVPSSGTQYILVAVSTSSDPEGTYNRYAFSYTYMPDYPKFAIWHDGLYMGANAFNSSNNFQGAYISAFDRTAMINGDPSPANVTTLDANQWSLFPTDADGLPSSSIGGCFFMNDDVGSYTNNTEVYLYQYDVNWTNGTGQLNAVNTFTVASYDLFNSGTEVPQSGASQKLDLLHYRIMYRPYYKHFADHDAILMTRTVNDGGTAAVRWYEFRNSGSGWSIYQQGTYNPGDGLWRWMSSIAMNDNGDIALGYSASGSSALPSVRCVARYANDPLNTMTTNELVSATSSSAQTGASRWGDYSMVSIDPSDNTSFWFTTEYTSGSWNWKTRIVHFALPVACTPPTTQASNFSASGIGDNQMTANWSRGNGDKVIVLAHEGSAVDANPSSGTSYTANATFGNGNEIGTGNYVVYDGTAGNVTVTGLTAGTQYYFAVYEYFTADNCYNSTGLTGNATTTGTAPCTPCYSWGNTDYSTSTTKVIFNTINNTSAKPVDGNGHAYSDYTAQSTDVTIGNSYDLTVNVNTDGNFTIATKVWIDWNQDCDFDDAGEEYDLGTASNVSDGATSNSPLSITVPAGALVGNTTMRVSSEYNSAATSCQTDFDGEVEDYSLNVVSGSTPLIAVTETALDFGDVGLGYYKTKTYDVSGTNLTNDITVTGTTDFQVSTDGTNFSNSVVLTQSGGTVNATTITVKFEPAAAQTYNGTITNVSSGATQQNVTCTGKGIQWFFPPTNLNASFATGTNNVDLTWNAPNTTASGTNWYEYANTADCASFNSAAYSKRVVYFHSDELSYTYPIKITQLRTGFYDNSNWSNTEFKFVIYGEDLTTKLYESPAQNANQNGSTSEFTYTLANPVTITGDFFIGIEPTAADGSPFNLLKKQTDNNYHSYAFDGTNWYYFSDGTNAYDIPQGVYIDGAKGGKWITANTTNVMPNVKKTSEEIDFINGKSPKSILTGYRVYKDGVQIGSDLSPNTFTYTDNSLCGSATYNVTALYTGYDGESDASNSVNMTYNAPAITTQPSGTTACEGDNVTFTVVATGNNLTYQWKKAGTNISGATSASYSLNSITSSDAATYTCVVANLCNSVTSNGATLTVETSTAITSQPSGTTVCAGDNVTFSVTATGSNLAYQWRKDGVNISGATSASYSINGVASGDAANYSCVVSGDCGNVTSNNAALTVNPQPVAPTSVSASPSSITSGNSSTLSYSGGSGTTFRWMTGSCGGTSIGTGNNLSVSPTSTTTYYGRWENTCGNSACKNVTVTVTGATYTISGTVKYDDASASAINGETVELYDNVPSVVGTTTTNASGAYSFSNISDGTYNVKPAGNLAWDGATAMDVTLYKKHIANEITLTGLKLTSGDVDDNGTLNTADLTTDLQKIVNPSGVTFTAGNWAYSDGSVSVSGANVTKNIQSICYGDANTSYFGAKSLHSIDVVNNGVLYINNGDYFELQVNLQNNINELASITLNIPYDENVFTITDVVMENNNSSMQYNASNGILRIAFSSLNTSDYNTGDKLFIIKGYVNNISGETDISDNITGEFGDYDNNVLNGIVFSMPSFAAASNVKNLEKEIYIFPNPANNYLNILNADNSRIEVSDILGSDVIISKTIDKINNRISTENLTQGTYILKIYKDNTVITKKFIIIK